MALKAAFGVAYYCMGADRGGSVGHGQSMDPWRVRVRDTSGIIRGGGILLDGSRVLTCAHVVPHGCGDGTEADPSTPQTVLLVDLLGHHDPGPYRARVMAAGWVPRAADNRGDVAVLELEEPVPGVSGAPLHRLSTHRGRKVRAFGFPADVYDGAWADAVLAGPAGEWVQMNARASAGFRVQGGFSGSAVTDDEETGDGETGHVIGMVVSHFTDAAVGVSWMLPIETIIGHVPLVDRYVSGERAFFGDAESALQDARPYGPPTERPEEGLVTRREFVDWLAADGAGAVKIFIGESVDGGSSALRQVVALTDRRIRAERANEIAAEAPADSLPQVGSIDVAVDASGKSVDEVVRRIAERLGIPAGPPAELIRWLLEPSRPMTLVVDAIDEASEPEALMCDLLAPLANQAPDHRLRLVMGFVRKSAATQLIAMWRGAGGPVLPDPARGTPMSADERAETKERLDRLTAVVAEVGKAEDALCDLAPRFLPHPVAWQGPSLSVWLAQLKAALTTGNRRALATLDAAEPTARLWLGQAEALKMSLEQDKRERDDLRGRLVASNADAIALGLSEDVELGSLYRTAHDLLWRAPFDLPAAKQAVDGHQQAVQRRLDD
jgi:hypothetical protein